MPTKEAVPPAKPPTGPWLRRMTQRCLSPKAFETLRRYSWRFRNNNWYVGKAVELTGNTVRFHGLKIALDNPIIPTRGKSLLFFQAHENVEIDYSTKYLDRSLPTVELGGSIGVLACLTDKWLSDPVRHIVVEANPAMVPTLVKNRDLNGCRFEIIAGAVGSREPFINFLIDDDFLRSRISEEGRRLVLVPTVSLKTILERCGFTTINLQVDVEGAELALIDDELETFRKHVKHLVMETHARYVTEEATARMLRKLEDAGFERVEASPPDACVVVYRNRALADGVASA